MKYIEDHNLQILMSDLVSKLFQRRAEDPRLEIIKILSQPIKELQKTSVETQTCAGLHDSEVSFKDAEIQTEKLEKTVETQTEEVVITSLEDSYTKQDDIETDDDIVFIKITSNNEMSVDVDNKPASPEPTLNPQKCNDDVVVGEAILIDSENDEPPSKRKAKDFSSICILT
jgi:hypothetical protein